MRHKELHWDLETGCELDLTVVGSYRYAWHESTFMRLFIYAFDDKPPECWQCEREPMPARLRAALLDDNVLKVGFNSMGFDSEVLEACEDIYIPTEAQRDILIRSSRYGLSGKLSKLAEEFLPKDEQKLETGKELIALFGRPLAQQKKTKARDALIEAGHVWADWETHPNEWSLYIEYGLQDVVAARSYDKRLPVWNDTPFEDQVLAVDRITNRRGIHIDRHYVEQCARLTDIKREDIKQQVMRLTGGISPRSFKKFKAWVQAHLPGRTVKGTSKDVVAELIAEGGLPDVVLQVFDLCGQATSSSISKFHTMLAYAMPDDDRMYWLLRIYGAGLVGRWAGRGPQPHNYPRPRSVDSEEVIAHFIRCMDMGVMPQEGMKIAVSSLRAAITPAPGKKFINADFASVEGRILAWVAGEQTVLDAYAAGKNLYLMNGETFGVPYEEMSKKHKLYLLCKVLELAMGYAGGVGAFMNMAKVYGLNMDKLAEDLHEHDLIPERLLHQANKLYHNPKFRKTVKATGLSQFTWCYMDAVKRAWRERRPATTTFWRKVDECVRHALDNPGYEYTCGANGMIAVEYDLESNFLGIRLPSGRILTYYKPKISGRSAEFAADGEEDDEYVKAPSYESYVYTDDYGVKHIGHKEVKSPEDTIISYLSLTEKGWTKVYIHGGKFVNNIVQGIARDLMAYATVNLDSKGWHVVLHVHDQALAELPVNDPRTEKDLEADMCELPEWAEGMYIEAEGEILQRFAK